MVKLLHIKATPRGDESRTVRIANAFLQAYRGANPADATETLDLFSDGIPEFDALAVAGKYALMHGEQASAEAVARWQVVVDTVDHFKSFDKYLLTCPMWNFAIPYKLKQYIDVLVQPTLTFSFDPEAGFSGLVGDKPVQLIASRGGDYAEGTGLEQLDSQLPYLKLILGFMGLTDVRIITAQPLDMTTPDHSQQVLAEAIAQAAQAGAQF